MAEKKLLIFHQGALGDVVLTFPALMRLKKHFPIIDAVCQPQLGELAKSLGLINRWFSQDSARIASLFSNAPDPDLKTQLNSYAEIILFSFSNDLAQSIIKIRNHPIHRIPPRPEPTENIHVAVHLLKNLSKSGLIAEDKGLSTPEQLSFFRHKSVIKKSSYSRKILLHPGAGSQKKMWPIDNFVQIERLLASDGYIPEYIIGPADRFLKDAIQIPGTRQSVVHSPETILALTALLKTADGFIGNDSGVSHLSACMGLPTVAVFGPSNPIMWQPLGPRVAILRPGCIHGSGPAGHAENAKAPHDFATITPAAVLASLYNIFS